MTQSDLYVYFVILSQLAEMKPSEILEQWLKTRTQNWKYKNLACEAPFTHMESPALIWGSRMIQSIRLFNTEEGMINTAKYLHHKNTKLSSQKYIDLHTDQQNKEFTV